MVQDGATYYFAYDQVGSLRAIVNESGAVIKAVRYDSFGNIIEDTNPDLTIPFGFAGGLHDRDTGLVRFGYRDYDPDTGRWTAKDPIGFKGGDVNVFGYVTSNPVAFYDTLGLTRECPSSPPKNDPAWRPYGGWGIGEWMFHCNFDCYLEKREDESICPADPQGECCYDSEGNLVDGNHKDAACGGSNNSYTDYYDHTFNDPGGIMERGWKGWQRSRKKDYGYYK